jgi:hypothetical protein
MKKGINTWMLIVGLLVVAALVVQPLKGTLLGCVPDGTEITHLQEELAAMGIITEIDATEVCCSGFGQFSGVYGQSNYHMYCGNINVGGGCTADGQAQKSGTLCCSGNSYTTIGNVGGAVYCGTEPPQTNKWLIIVTLLIICVGFVFATSGKNIKVGKDWLRYLAIAGIAGLIMYIIIDVLKLVSSAVSSLAGSVNAFSSSIVGLMGIFTGAYKAVSDIGAPLASGVTGATNLWNAVIGTVTGFFGIYNTAGTAAAPAVVTTSSSAYMLSPIIGMVLLMGLALLAVKMLKK